MRAVWLVVVRDVVLLALGAGGMVRELFFATDPNPLIVGTCLLMIGGTAAIQAWWLVRNGGPSGIARPLPPSPPSSVSSDSSGSR